MRTELTPEQFHSLAILWDMLNKSLSEPEPKNCKTMNQKTCYAPGKVRASRRSTRTRRVHKIRNDEWMTQ